MWQVLKYKFNELDILKKSIKNTMGDNIEFYQPKIKISRFFKNKNKSFEKKLLNNFIFCRHKYFNSKKIISGLKNLKGLIYFLDGGNLNQKEIVNFINICKDHEDNCGFIKQSFFDAYHKTENGMFISGMFSNLIFKVIRNKKNKMKILCNNKKIIVNKKNNTELYNFI